MAAKKKLTPLQQRDRRAKKMLVGLGVILLAVLGFELPGLLGGKSATPTAAPAGTSSAVGGTTPAAVSSLAGLPVSPPAQAGSLVSFSRFAVKDPFHALVALGAEGTAGGPAKKQASGHPSAKRQTPTKPVTFSVERAKTSANLTTALVPAVVIKLNGKRRVIPVGAGFPEAHPVFKLISVGAKSIWISLIGGSFSGGKQTVQIDAGHPVKLVNTTAAINYLIQVVRVTTAPRPQSPSTTDRRQASAANDTAGATTTGATTTTAP